MRIKHRGVLSKNYFKAYMNLVMNTQNCPLVLAKETTFDRIFKMDRTYLGDEVYNNFATAYEELLQENET